jgi:POT family proton-dependent oligopeptide transporter
MSGEVQHKGHPIGLYLLFVTEMAERFSYYGMRSIFMLYLTSALFDEKTSNGIYGAYTGLVYLTPMLGGWISDKFWGNRKSIITGGILMAIGQFLMFFSACFVNQSKFSEKGAIDGKVNNTMSMIILVLGLFFLIFGNGFFKPNISVMVGDLYEPDDNRKDAAYTIFYMGVNLGAFIAPLVCGAFAPTEGWKNPSAYKWGFFCAGLGMIFSTVIFVVFKNRWIKTPEGLQIGLSPKEDQVKAKRAEQSALVEKQLKAESGEDEKDEAEKEEVKNSPLRIIISAVVGIVLFAGYFIFLREKGSSDVIGIAVEVINGIVIACAIALPLFIITDKGLNHNEKTRIGSIYIIAAFVIFFWGAYEQAGSSLTNFAESNVNRMIGSFEFKTAWFQSINPIAIVVLAPVFAAIWEILAKYNLEPFSPAKQAMGLIILGLGYLVITFGVNGIGPHDKTSMWWLVALYLIHTIGELFLSPIGNSLVYKLAPARLASLLMAVWLMSSSVSNVVAGKLANYSPTAAREDANGKLQYSSMFGITIDTLGKFFTIFTIMGAAAGIVMFAFCPLLKRMMKGIK